VSTNSEVDLAAALADLGTTNQLELLMAGSEDAPPLYAPPPPPDDDAIFQHFISFVATENI
jgi:hypothetical protein